MNAIRVLLFLYILVTPILFFILVYLSVRTRNILLERVWLRRYLLPSFILFLLIIVNFGILFRMFPNQLGHVDISCVSYGDIEQDLSHTRQSAYVGLVEIKALDYIERAHVFQPQVVGYIDYQYYPYQVVSSYKNTIDLQGLLRASENHPAILMDPYPCALLENTERISEGVYLIASDDRTIPLSYQDQWFDQAIMLFSYQKIDDYALDKSFEEQEIHVKEQVQDLLDLMN